MAKESVGFVMCCFGAAEFAGGFTIGRFVDSYGRGPGAALAAAFCTAALVCTWIGSGNLIDYCTCSAQSRERRGGGGERGAEVNYRARSAHSTRCRWGGGGKRRGRRTSSVLLLDVRPAMRFFC